MASDVCAGKTAGCRTILIDCDYNKDVEADIRVKDLQGVVESLKNRVKNTFLSQIAICVYPLDKGYFLLYTILF